MGNETTIYKKKYLLQNSHNKNSYINSHRYSTIQQYKNQYQQNNNNNKKQYHTINRSLQIQPKQSSKIQNKNYKFQIVNSQQQSQNKQSLQEYQNLPSIRKNSKQKTNDDSSDHILQRLSIRNEELRKQLKKISQSLTEKLKKKKFIQKRKQQQIPQLNNQGNKIDLSNAGIKRQLQNGYKQIDMYKRTLSSLKGNQQNQISYLKMNKLQSQINLINIEIQKYLEKINSYKKIKQFQDKTIQKDISQTLKQNIEILKKQSQELKNKLKQFNKKDRQRQNNYKKQQAYLYQVEKKWRDINGDYFPQLGRKIKNHLGKNIEDNQFRNYKEFQQAELELRLLRAKHQEYHRRIDAFLMTKNRRLQQNNIIVKELREKQKIIEGLKVKLQQSIKVSKPIKKKGLFRYDSNYKINNENSQEQQNDQSINQNLIQNQFDVQHLIANIPKPVRPKPIQVQVVKKGKKNQKIQNNNTKKNQGGMIITNQKSQPKKWGSQMIRFQEKGKLFKNQSIYNDKSQFPQTSKSLIIGVNVWLSRNKVLQAIQAIYLDKEQIRYGLKSSQPSDATLQRYDLQNPDYLKNITGCFGEDGFIESLTFSSKKGKIITYGIKNDSQQNFTFGITSTQRPFRLSGASTKLEYQPRFHRLGIEICQEEN